jgi:uncharacterized Zn-finger protein
VDPSIVLLSHYYYYSIISSQVHVERKQFPCGLCAMVFRHKSSLVRHMCQHTGQRPHPCSACRQSFLTPARLRRHGARRHNNPLDSPPPATLAVVECEIIAVMDAAGECFTFLGRPEERVSF